MRKIKLANRYAKGLLKYANNAELDKASNLKKIGIFIPPG